MMFLFTGTVANWITQDWELVKHVIDFHPLVDQEHEGQYAALRFAKSSSQMNILEKICVFVWSSFHANGLIIHCRYLLTITMDNISVNLVLAESLVLIL